MKSFDYNHVGPSIAALWRRWSLVILGTTVIVAGIGVNLPGMIENWQASREVERNDAEYKRDVQSAIEAAQESLKQFADGMHSVSQAELDHMGYHGAITVSGSDNELTIVFSKLDRLWCERIIDKFSKLSDEIRLNGEPLKGGLAACSSAPAENIEIEVKNPDRKRRGIPT